MKLSLEGIGEAVGALDRLTASTEAKAKKARIIELSRPRSEAERRQCIELNYKICTNRKRRTVKARKPYLYQD
jgi:hypothetical protein